MESEQYFEKPTSETSGPNVKGERNLKHTTEYVSVFNLDDWVWACLR
jgi:hypothetical protein